MKDKSFIRNEIKNRREELSSSFIQKSSLVIFEKLKSYLEPINYNNIMFYKPIKNEVDTTFMIEYFEKLGKSIFLPTIKNSMIIPSPFSHNDKLVSGSFNILEPLANLNKKNPPQVTIDVVIVPCIACDKKLNRIGYGKGFYDQFLNDSQFKIGIVYDFQMLNTIPTENHDKKLDLIITEHSIYK